MDGPPDFVVVPASGAVEAWSVRRLPFEPREAMLEFRNALRAALAGLESESGRLRCVYSSASTDFCDAENVLLYNVGMSSFGRLMERGVTFERAHLVPPCPTPLSGPALHHVRYATHGTEAFLHWRVTDEIASWESPAPTRLDKAVGWWWATRTGSRFTTGGDLANQPYGLHVQIGGLRRTTASVLKPMLDGIIAGFHRDGLPSDEAVARLAGDIGEIEGLVRAQLTASDAALGSRVVVRPFRDGLQWNPADDLCVACSVENGGPSSASVVRGRLLALAPTASL